MSYDPNQPRVPAGSAGGGEWAGDVNQAEVVRVERQNDSMDTVTLHHHSSKRDSDFPVDSVAGGVFLNSGTERPGRTYINTTETSLKVGDRITTGGEVIEGGGSGAKEATRAPERQTPDYRDTFAEEHRPRKH